MKRVLPDTIGDRRTFSSKFLFLILGLIAACCLCILFPAPVVLRLGAATLLACFLPGWLLLQAIGLTMEDWLEQVILASAASYATTIFIALAVLYATGRLATTSMVGALALGSLALFGICAWRASCPVAAPPVRSYFHGTSFLIVVSVAAFFSLTNLGYSDYWGDEMNSLLRAVSIVAGQQDVIFQHTKGPVEVLLPATFGLLVGRFEPYTLRFPFALAQIVAAGGFYLFARRLFNERVALLASLLLIINGLYLAFGRIVQYQVIMFLMTGLSMLLVYCFYRAGKGIYLALASVLLGIGLLAHYDTLMVLPPVGYLVWRHYERKGVAWRHAWRQLAVAATALLGVTAFFYVPFFLHPHLAETSSYLSRIVGVSNWPANNFDELYVFAVMYNSVLYVSFIVLIGTGTIIADLVRLYYQKRRNMLFWGLVAFASGMCLIAVVAGRPLLVALIASIFGAALLIGLSSVSEERKLVYVWVAISFIGYVFFVDHPRTHLQIIYPGWSLLGALGLEGLLLTLQPRYAVLRSRGVLFGIAGLLCMLFGLFAGYEYLLFLDSRREYILTYPEHKSPLYWEDEQFPFGSRRLYGAPHRLGWQMINQLFLTGDLEGDWDSNDEGSNLFWYTLGFPRNSCYPRYYFLAEFQQREELDNAGPSFSLDDYREIGQVWNRDRLQIKVYKFSPTDRAGELITWREPELYSSFVVTERFRSAPYVKEAPAIAVPLPEPPRFRPSPTALEQIADYYGDARIKDVRDTAALVGYDLDDTWAKPGGRIVLTLYWQAVEVVNLPYKIFVHLEGDAEAGSPAGTWAQSDDFPACGTSTTQRWQIGQTVVDRHVVSLPEDMPAGDYVLKVGLYEPRTGLRMDLLDTLGNPQGTSYQLGYITLRLSSEVGREFSQSFSSHSSLE
jgi:4-amino-4-deoxy-L-arabinose transferase-like glycosyltransferase